MQSPTTHLSGYNSNVSATVYEPPPVQLQHLNLAAGNKSVFATNSTDVANLEAAGYTYSNGQGGIEPSTTCAVGLVPLYRYVNSTTSEYALASTSAEITALTTAGYSVDSTIGGSVPGLLGYVYPASSGGSQGGFPLYEYYNTHNGNYTYTQNSTPPTNYAATAYSPECYVCPRWTP